MLRWVTSCIPEKGPSNPHAVLRSRRTWHPCRHPANPSGTRRPESGRPSTPIVLNTIAILRIPTVIAEPIGSDSVAIGDGAVDSGPNFHSGVVGFRRRSVGLPHNDQGSSQKQRNGSSDQFSCPNAVPDRDVQGATWQPCRCAASRVPPPMPSSLAIDTDLGMLRRRLVRRLDGPDGHVAGQQLIQHDRPGRTGRRGGRPPGPATAPAPCSTPFPAPALVNWLGRSSRAMPKSISFTVPSSPSQMFSGLTSRCTVNVWAY